MESFIQHAIGPFILLLMVLAVGTSMLPERKDDEDDD